MSKTEKPHKGKTVPEPMPEANPEPNGEGAAEMAENPEAELPVETSPVNPELEKELVTALAQAAEFKDGWQRSVADFQNYKRRVEAEKAETYQMALGSIIKSYLPIVDDLERALAACPADLAWVNGIELIYRKLQGILETAGLKRIEAEGQLFDPNLHEAIAQEPCEGTQSGQVIAVVQNGYILGGRVIRPAQVRVAK